MTHPAITVLQEINAAMPKSQWMSVDDLKAEYRASGSGDTYGDCMAAWFPVATELAIRGDDVPAEWAFRAGAGGPQHEDGDYWADIVQQASTEALLEFGALMCRLHAICKARGLDY